MDTNEFKFGFNAFWWEKLWDETSIREAVTTLSGLGYKAVEWKETSFNPRASLTDEFKRAVKVTQENGLIVSDFVILRDMVNPQARDKSIQDVTSCIEAVAESGIDKMNISTAGIPPGLSVQRAWDNLFDAFDRFLKVAEKEKVYLVVEPVVGQLCHDYFTGQVLLRKFDSEYLAVTFDPSHDQLYRNDIPWCISQWGDKIKHVHLKDAVGQPGEFGIDFLFPILGEGAINWGQFFEALSDINYQGIISAEFESFKYMDEVLNNDPVKAAEITMESIKRLSNFRDVVS